MALVAKNPTAKQETQEMWVRWCGSPRQSSCLENPVDRGAWQATVHGVGKSGTRLSAPAVLFSVT